MQKLFLVGRKAFIASELEERLFKLGYEILGFTTSLDDVTELVDELKPDTVLFDILISDQKKIHTIIDEIRSRRSTAIVFLSACEDDKSVDQFKNIAPSGFIFKPLKDAQIKATLELAMYRHHLDNHLASIRCRYHALSKDQNALICLLDREKSLIFINDAFCDFFKNDYDNFMGHSFTMCLPHSYWDTFHQEIDSLNQKRPVRHFSHPFYRSNGTSGWLEWVIRGLLNRNGEIVEYQMLGNDISKRVALETALQKAKEDVDRRVKERTFQLEGRLTDLKDDNTTLRVLLEKMNKERSQLKEDIIIKVKEFVIPYVKQLKDTASEKDFHTCLSTIETHLEDMISPFMTHISGKYKSLSSIEVKIVHLVRQGKTAKEIAALLSMSSRTIESYRCRIRRKLGLLDRRIKLKTYLDSLDE